MAIAIVSGGQTGVDRAALDAAREAGVAHGGWCPRGRRAEDGAIPAHYPLRETPEADPAQRTTWNARDADATLALVRGEARGGTALAVERATALGRPVLVLDLDAGPRARDVVAWLRSANVGTLNVAGPRESEALGIYGEALALLRSVLNAVPSGNSTDHAAGA
jgi:hypothetical protein